jgi:hypothetical protein
MKVTGSASESACGPCPRPVKKPTPLDGNQKSHSAGSPTLRRCPCPMAQRSIPRRDMVSPQNNLAARRSSIFALGISRTSLSGTPKCRSTSLLSHKSSIRLRRLEQNPFGPHHVHLPLRLLLVIHLEAVKCCRLTYWDQRTQPSLLVRDKPKKAIALSPHTSHRGCRFPDVPTVAIRKDPNHRCPLGLDHSNCLMDSGTHVGVAFPCSPGIHSAGGAICANLQASMNSDSMYCADAASIFE